MRRLAAIPTARTYLAGEVLSVLGDTALWLALAIWVRELTGSSAAAGIAFLCLVAPMLLSPLLGALADRMRRKPLLVAGNLAGAVLTLSLLAVQGRGQVWLIYTVMAGYGVLQSLLGAAQVGLLKDLVPDDLLGEANGALSTAREGLRLVAPLLGAGLFAFAGGHVVAVLDSATFVVAACTVVRTTVTETVTEPPGGRFRDELMGGLAHVRATPDLGRLVITFAAVGCVIGLGETAGISAVTDGLHASGTWMGVTQSLMGVGALVGGPTAARAMRRFGDTRVLALGLLAFAVGIATWAVPSLAVVVATRAIGGFGLTWLLVAFNTLVARSTPGSLQGRVNAVVETSFAGPQTVSVALGAALLPLVGFRPLVFVEAVVVAVVGLSLLVRAPRTVAVAAI